MQTPYVRSVRNLPEQGYLVMEGTLIFSIEIQTYNVPPWLENSPFVDGLDSEPLACLPVLDIIYTGEVPLAK